MSQRDMTSSNSSVNSYQHVVGWLKDKLGAEIGIEVRSAMIPDSLFLHLSGVWVIRIVEEEEKDRPSDPGNGVSEDRSLQDDRRPRSPRDHDLQLRLARLRS